MVIESSAAAGDMSDSCRRIHGQIAALPAVSYAFEPKRLPKNGIYLTPPATTDRRPSRKKSRARRALERVCDHLDGPSVGDCRQERQFRSGDGAPEHDCWIRGHEHHPQSSNPLGS
jgi:hypothetical protein